MSRDPQISDDEPSIEPVIVWCCAGGWVWIVVGLLGGWI